MAALPMMEIMALPAEHKNAFLAELDDPFPQLAQLRPFGGSRNATPPLRRLPGRRLRARRATLLPPPRRLWRQRRFSRRTEHTSPTRRRRPPSPPWQDRESMTARCRAAASALPDPPAY